MLSTKVYEIVERTKRDVEFSENYYFNHYETIKRINLYLNNRFLSKNNGIFWNISNPRVQHFAKNIELDTKDLMPYGVGETNMAQSWVLRIKLRQWLDEEKLAIELNDLAETCSAYGSAVWKIVDNKAEMVNLSNLYFDPLSKEINDSDLVELHYLTKNELMEKKEVWDSEAIDKVLEEESEDGRYEVWEYYGMTEEEDEYTFKRVVGYGRGNEETILYEEEMKKEDSPYYDFHIGKYEGRWLRIGVVERLFSLQEKANKLVNQNDQASEIASLLLLKSANPDFTGNILEKTINGEIIPDETLQQIGITNVGLNNFIQEMTLIEAQADRLCLTPEVISGEPLPSGTPFRSLAALTNAARSAFKMIRERIGEKIGYILKEEILPDVIKNWNKGDLLNIVEDDVDIEMFNQSLIARTMRNAILNGKLVDSLALEQIEKAVTSQAEKQGRKLKIPKGYFNFKYGIKFNITGEAYDKAQQNAAYEAAINYMIANPAFINTPLAKQWLENNGISYWKIKPEEIQQLAQGQQAMGGQGGQPQSTEPKKDTLMSSIDTE